MKIVNAYIDRNGNIFILTDNSHFHPTGAWYRVPADDSDLKSEVESYLAEHPEALVPEPVPPEPSAEELAARRIQELKSKLYDIDVKTARPARLVALGRATQEDLDKLNALEDEAEVLREELRGLLQ